MAGNGKDLLLGKLTLNIKDVEDKAKKVEKLLDSMKQKSDNFSSSDGVKGLSKAFQDLANSAPQIKQNFSQISGVLKSATNQLTAFHSAMRKVYDLESRPKTKDQLEYNRLIKEQFEVNKRIAQLESTQRTTIGDSGRIAAEKELATLRLKESGIQREIENLRKKGISNTQQEVELARQLDAIKTNIAVKESKADSSSKQKQYNALLNEQLKIEKQLATMRDLAQNGSTDSVKTVASGELLRLEQERQYILSQISSLQEQGIKNTALEEKNARALAEHEAKIALTRGKATEQLTVQTNQWDKIVASVTHLATSALWRTITNTFRDATSYVSSFYDALNEIRIVTGMTEEQASVVGEDYIKMAKEMSVSSAEIASAAVEFYRQGLSEEETDKRVEWATKYAKIAGLEFNEAAELVTAATNSMGIDIQRVVDVFSYLGDASASGADEIGIAMQKASGAANEAGLSFEWLGAYIATVSERTRQAPEVIGTAFNSIMARLHNIKAKGFNEEDETKINDIAKALASLPEPIRLIDEATGEWIAMSDVFSGIAAQWGSIDDKARAYVATTIAGTRQQNIFLNLMNDMSKGVEGGSRAWELYAGAVNSAGNANEKYAIWMESVKASQGDLTAALQEFYSLLSADVLKGFYSGLATLVEGLTQGTSAMNGMNLVIPLVVSGIVGLTVAIVTAGTSAGATAFSIKALWTAITAHPIGLAITAFFALTAALTGLAAATQTAKKDISTELSELESDISKMAQTQAQFTQTAANIETLKNRYVELTSKTTLTASEQEELMSVMKQIADLSPALRSAISDVETGFGNEAAVVNGLNAELKEYLELQKLAAQSDARDVFKSAGEAASTWKNNEVNYTEREKIFEDYRAFIDNEYTKQGGNYFDGSGEKVSAQKMAEDYLVAYIRRGLDGVFGDNAIGVNDRLKNAKIIASTFGHDDYDTWAGNQTHRISNGTVRLTDSGIQLASVLASDFANHELDQKTHDAQLNQIKASVEATMNAFKDTDGLSKDILEAANAEAKAVEDAIDYTSETLTTDLEFASNQISDIYQRAQDEQAKIDADLDMSSLQNDIDKARAEFDKSSTKENFDAYNELVDQWNALYQDMPKEKLDEKLVKDVQSGIEATTEIVGAGAAYAKAIADRKGTESAAIAGFKDQLNEAKNRLGKDGNDYVSYRQYMDELASTNESLYTAMLDAYPELADIYNVDKTGQDAIASIDNAIKLSDNVAKEMQAYYAGIQGNIVTPPETGSTADYTQILKNALLAGGEDNGVASMLAQFDVMSDEAQAALLEIMPWLATLEDSAMSVNDILALMNESFATITSVMGDDYDESQFMTFLESLMNADESGLNTIAETIKGMSDSDLSELKKEFEGLDGVWEDIVDGGKLSDKTLEHLNRTMNRMNLAKKAKYFNGTADAVNELAQGTISAHDAFDTFNDDTEKLNNALSEYETVNKKMSKGLKVTEEEVQTIAEYLSATPDNILKQWDIAGAALISAIQEGTNALSALRDQAFINIVGTSSVDFSAVYSGLLSIKNLSDEAIEALCTLGMFQQETISLPQDFITYNADGSLNHHKANAKATVLVPTSGSPFKSTVPKKSGGGGGGGGSQKTEATTDEQNLVSNMEFEIDTISNKLKQLDLIMSRYDTQGYLTGLINALKMENDLLTQQSAIYQKNIDTLKPKLDALKAQLATQTSGTEAYNETLKQIEVLQDAYVEYSLALEENTNSILENNEAIKDHQDAIRDMEIELRNTILEAIEDRMDREEAALDARIEMEEEVLDAIIARHERERDEILETTEAQIQALEDEKDMLDEMLDARRQAAEEEDKLAELANLEAKYNRIIADPTRMKEARDILTEIEDLRDEIAWDTAEKEVEAQKDSLDQQITSLEDYMSYIEEYYEELLNNPRNFIEEVDGILSQSCESILGWLKANNEEFANSTDSTREQMIAGWTDTLNTMRGVIVTYWEEVESIIAGGDDAIIEFLKQNSQEYLEAGRLQAEAYVDGWREQLGDLNAAHKNVTPEIKDLDEINVTETIVNSGAKKSGGSGSGGSKSTSTVGGSSGGTGFFDNIFAAAGQMLNTAVDAVKKSETTKARSVLNRNILKYATGGVADYTGLAWIDGSKSRPERILSAEQTQLFETLVASLQSIKMRGVSVPSMSLEESSHGTNMTFGDIVVQVEQLNDETDYEELGERIMTAIMDKANRGSSVGGIRITR